MRVPTCHGECLGRVLRRAGRVAVSLLPGILGLASIPQAAAAILTVGASGSGCDHTSVQAAVSAAGSAAGTDEIRIARSAAWTAQQITIDTYDEIHLIGGYATCTSTTPDGTKTVLSGAGGDARPVLTIRGNGFVYLRGLTIRDGDQAGDDNGGGVNFAGGGILDIADTAITENSANDGGGIHATGTTITAEVVLGADVTVSSNIARNSGGGMVSKSLETSILGPRTTFIFNEALGQDGGGYGGGIVVVSDQFKSYAYITSNGVGGIGVIYGNEAVHGGGLAVLAGQDSEQEARARIYSTDSAQPVRINGNVASSRGGGIYTQSDADAGAGGAYASAQFWRAALNDNRAPDGAAAYIDRDEALLSDQRSSLWFIGMDEAAACPLGTPCNEMIGNSTENTTGAIVRSLFGSVDMHRMDIRGNEGGRVLYATDYPISVVMNALIADNNVAQELIRSADEDSGRLTMSHVTFAGNTIGAPHVLFVDQEFNFDRSLIAQPDKLTLANSPGLRNIEYVLTNDTSNMTGSFILIDPRFIDPASRDYHLRAGSTAVDFAPQVGGSDLEGRPHTLDMPNGGITGRTADAGAYERPALQPLVLNSDFDTDLGFWTGLSESFWDATNASGPSGSGSVRVPPVEDPEDVDTPDVVGRSQCIHLPGPGFYRLNGWGKVSGTMFESNSVMLRWELRYNGGAASCENGAIDLTDTHILATSNTWHRPASAAIIEVPDAAWTRNTSLTIKLDTAGNQMPPTGWFDGITLDVDVEASDTIFENGFEVL